MAKKNWLDSVADVAGTALGVAATIAVVSAEAAVAVSKETVKWTKNTAMPIAAKATSEAWDATSDFASKHGRSVERAIKAATDAYSKADKSSSDDVFEKKDLPFELTQCHWFCCSEICVGKELYCANHLRANWESERAAKTRPCSGKRCRGISVSESGLCPNCLIEYGAYRQRKHGSKRQHKSRLTAERHLQDLEVSEWKARDTYIVYECEFCNHFHVGHKKDTVKDDKF